MIISDSCRFLFVHVPKTGGTSLSEMLKDEGSSRHDLCLSGTKHETIRSFDQRVGVEKISGYKMFAIVRHPLERIVSHFRYLKSHPAQFPEMLPVQTLDAYVDAIASGDMTILRRPERFMHQFRWVSMDDGTIPVKIFRYEDVGQDFSEIISYLGLIKSHAPIRNKSTHARPYVSGHTQSFVERFYSKDFELFGY